MKHAIASVNSYADLSVVHTNEDVERPLIESFISEVFAAKFAATLESFLPSLVAIRSPAGTISAAAGFRCAGAGPLFLEQYLDEPIESTIRSHFGEVVNRAAIVEVGNLATRGGCVAVTLIAKLIPLLISQGYVWVAFTGNDAVRNLFQRLHLFPFAICRADAESLGTAGASWGTYYEHHPIVMAGRLHDGAAAIALPRRS